MRLTDEAACIPRHNTRVPRQRFDLYATLTCLFCLLMVASDCTVLAAQDVWLPLVPYTRVETCKITISFTGQVKALGFGTVALIGRRPKSVSICTRRETQSISIEPPGNDTKKSTILPAGVSKKNVYSEQPWFDFCSFPHHLKTGDIITPNFFCKQLTVRFSSLAIHFSTRNNM